MLHCNLPAARPAVCPVKDFVRIAARTSAAAEATRSVCETDVIVMMAAPKICQKHHMPVHFRANYHFVSFVIEIFYLLAVRDIPYLRDITGNFSTVFNEKAAGLRQI